MLKRNELSSHEKTWRNLKYILLCEEANLESLHSMISTTRNAGKGKTMEIVIARDGGRVDE